MLRKFLLALFILGLCAAPARATTLLLASSGSGGPEVTSGSFTPTAGDAVIAVLALQNAPPALTALTTSGYTWTCNAGAVLTNYTLQICWAFNVPSGAKTFTTTGLSFNNIIYDVLDVPSLTGTVDQTVHQDNSATVNSNATASNNEVAICDVANNNPGTYTPETGFTAFAENTTLSNSPYLDVDYDPNVTPSGTVLTGCYSTGASFPAAMMTLFEATAPSPTPTPTPTPSPEAEFASTPSITNVVQLGTVLGNLTYYGTQFDYTQNTLENGGFEPTTSGRVVTVPSGAGLSSTTFCDQYNYYNAPASFYNGATFEDIETNGTVRGTGTITGYAVSGTSCAAGSTYPEFTYSAGFTIVAGDYVRFTGTANIAGQSTYPPAGAWWNSDSDITIVSDERTGGDGVQSIAFGLNGSAHTITSYGDAGPGGNYGGISTNFRLISGNWTVSCYAKEVGATTPAIELKFVRGATTFLDQTFTPTASWANYSYTFTGNETDLTSNFNETTFTITGTGSAGSIHVDDCYVGPATAPTVASWSNDLVRVLSTMHPGVLREQQSGADSGDSYANYIADDSARGPSSDGGPQNDWSYNLDQFFQLCSYLHAVPWINIPAALTTTQYGTLGAYLVSEQAIYNFPQILVEWGNEMWNGGQCQGVCYSTNSSAFSVIEQHDYAALKAGASSPSWLKLVGASQYEVGSVSSDGGPLAQLIANVTSANYAAGAPYYLNALTAGTVAQDMSALFGSLQSEANYANSQYGVPMTLYEGGPNAYNTPSPAATPAPISEINGVVSGAASGTSDGLNALNAWSGGVAIQCPYVVGLPAFSSAAYNGVQIWGMVLTLPSTGSNPIFRPRGLVEELLNTYFMPNDAGSYYPTSTNTYSGTACGGWKSSGGLWNVACVNTNSTPQTMNLVWSSAQTNLPSGTVKTINYTNGIEDTNDTNSGVLVTLGNSTATITPVSNTEVTLNNVPAYSIVVAQAASATPSAAPPNPGSLLLSAR
jgi:hypothetical protein